MPAAAALQGLQVAGGGPGGGGYTMIGAGSMVPGTMQFDASGGADKLNAAYAARQQQQQQQLQLHAAGDGGPAQAFVLPRN